MKFIMTVKNTRTGSEWPESYDYHEAKCAESAEKIARDMVKQFNKGLREGEASREFVSIQLEGASNSHRWEKDLLRMSANFRGRVIDGMICENCGVSGKRFGISGHIKIDSKFKKKVFQTCGNEAKAAVDALGD